MSPQAPPSWPLPAATLAIAAPHYPQRAACKAMTPSVISAVLAIPMILVSVPTLSSHVFSLTSKSGGGDGYWNVFYTSDDTNVDWYSGGSSSSTKSGSNSASSSTTQASSQTTGSTTSAASDKATVITSVAPGKTVVITQVPDAAASTTAAASDEKSHKGGSNTAGIAAGVVVAVVVVAALIGAAYFFWRRRQRQQAETGHQQLSDYSGSGTRPMTYRPAPGPDSRLDHDAMAQRRMSDGSIADNQDYSRRILKVSTDDFLKVTL